MQNLDPLPMIQTHARPNSEGNVLQAYRERCTNLGIPQDEALAALLAFLVLYLEPVQKKMRSRRHLVQRGLELTGVASVATAALAIGCRLIGSKNS